MIKLDVGSGADVVDSSFITIDPFVDSADIQAMMWDLPFEDGTVDLIWASHCLEHISKFQVIPTFKEWARVLKVGGRIHLIVPDLTWSCAWWLKYPATHWSMDILYGVQTHEGEFHRTGYTVDILKFYIDEFKELEIEKIAYSGMTLEDIDKEYINGDTITQRVINCAIVRI